jgi:HPt (histidine-containing phosphotransfer) domain-containing protein
VKRINISQGGSMDLTNDANLRYLKRRADDLKLFSESIELKNFVEVEKIGHRLKGSGATFGYQELSELGQIMEGAAKRKDVFELEKVKEVFSEWINLKIN